MKHKTNLYAYLDAIGVLEHGTDAEIKEAKRIYRRKYMTAYRRKQREDRPEYNVSLSQKNGDCDKIHLAAKQHNMTVSAFLRRATLAYLDRVYILPSRALLVRLDQLLMNSLNEVRSITGIREKHHWQQEEKIAAIAAHVNRLQQDVRALIAQPIDLEITIKNAVATRPAFRDQLRDIIADDR